MKDISITGKIDSKKVRKLLKELPLTKRVLKDENFISIQIQCKGQGDKRPVIDLEEVDKMRLEKTL